MGRLCDIETIRLFGARRMNDDGFTYVYGKFKSGRVKRARNQNQTARNRRADKRAVKAKARRRYLSDAEI